MIVITKDRVSHCSEIKLDGDKLLACGEGGWFVALDAPNEMYAKAIFEVTQKKVLEGAQVIDFSDDEVRSTIEDKKMEPIQEVSALEAIRIARVREPVGLFMHIETVDGKTRYIAIDNEVERAYVESFDDEETCRSWLRGEFEVEWEQ